MALTFRSPFFTDFFDHAAREMDLPKQLAKGVDFHPQCDLSETEKEYRVVASLPGVPKENIHVDLTSNVLTISGEVTHESETKDEGKHWHKVERSYGSFSRAFSLPKDRVDKENIAATFDNGVLQLTLPKRPPPASEKLKINIA